MVINGTRDQVEATIVWRAGAQQRLLIEWPRLWRGGKMTWTEAENAWLREQYPTAMSEALQAQFPHRSYMAIRRQAEVLGLQRPQRGRPKPKGPPWTAAENAAVRAYATGEISYGKLRSQLPERSEDAIDTQRRVLGLTRQQKSMLYQVIHDTLELVPEEGASKQV